MKISVSLRHLERSKHVIQVDYSSLQTNLVHLALQRHLYAMSISLQTIGIKSNSEARAEWRGRLTSYIQESKRTLSSFESLYKVACVSVFIERGSFIKVGPPDESLVSSSSLIRREFKAMSAECQRL
jgi:hypothetical protein